MEWIALATLIISSIATIASTQSQAKQSKENIELQNDFNVEQWERNNNYNETLFGKQVENYRKLGMSEGGIISAMSGMSPFSSQPVTQNQIPQTMNFQNLADMMSNAPGMMEDIKIKHAQISNIESMTAKNKAETGQIIELTPAIIKRENSQAWRNYYDGHTSRKAALSQIQVNNSIIGLNSEKVKEIAQNCENLRITAQLMNEDFAIKQAIKENTEADTEYKKSQTALNMEKVNEVKASITNIGADTTLKNTMAYLNTVNSTVSEAEFKLKMKECWIKDLEIVYKEFGSDKLPFGIGQLMLRTAGDLKGNWEDVMNWINSDANVEFIECLKRASEYREK